MALFVHHIDLSDEDQIVEHFENIPDMTEYILESDQYPLYALNEVLATLHNALHNGHLDTSKLPQYRQTVMKIESVIATRVDYVRSIIAYLLGHENFENQKFSLEDSPTKEILFHIDLMKDVARSPRIDYEDYKAALRKFIKTLKLRFNKGLEIHKKLYPLEFKEIAENQELFSREILQEQKRFLEDALAMTRSHIPVKPIQVYQLKETLFKIFESMGVRILQTERFHARTKYSALLKEIEELIVGIELDFGQKIVNRFSNMLPEYIADHWNFDVIRHNRRLVELFIDCIEDTALLSDLYKILINLTIAEATQSQNKQELSRASFNDLQGLTYVKNEENALLSQIEKFKSLDITEQARELIKLSLYGLCEYISRLPIEEFGKYPIGIVKSSEKMLMDLEQHRLRDSDIQKILNVPEYITAVETIKDTLSTYDSSKEKYNFVDIYKETDFIVDGITYCAFNDIILRLIQNAMEAYFAVDAGDGKFSPSRLSEMKITIAERYKTEWIRQNRLRQEIEQQAMEKLAEELT